MADEGDVGCQGGGDAVVVIYAGEEERGYGEGVGAPCRDVGSLFLSVLVHVGMQVRMRDHIWRHFKMLGVVGAMFSMWLLRV